MMARIVHKLNRMRHQWHRQHWQRQQIDPSQPKQVVFVLGAQRSGTTLMMRLFEQCPYATVYHETGRNAAFKNFRLRSWDVVKRQIERSGGSTVILKPICDSQWGDELLTYFPSAKAIWMYRHYYDVANSAVQKWGDHQKDIMRQIVADQRDQVGWRGERLDEAVVAQIKTLYSETLSDHEGAVLQWILRNNFYYSLGLDQHPRVALVNYRQVVQNPESMLARIFAFCQLPFDKTLAAQVHSSSVSREQPFALAEPIQAVADALWHRLEANQRVNL